MWSWKKYSMAEAYVKHRAIPVSFFLCLILFSITQPSHNCTNFTSTVCTQKYVSAEIKADTELTAASAFQCRVIITQLYLVNLSHQCLKWPLQCFSPCPLLTSSEAHAGFQFKFLYYKQIVSILYKSVSVVLDPKLCLLYLKQNACPGIVVSKLFLNLTVIMYK